MPWLNRIAARLDSDAMQWYDEDSSEGGGIIHTDENLIRANVRKCDLWSLQAPWGGGGGGGGNNKNAHHK